MESLAALASRPGVIALTASPLPGGGTPSPTPTPVPEPTPPACWQAGAPDSLCRRVHDLVGVPWIAEWADLVIARPAAILFILLGAILARMVTHRVIDRLSRRAAEGTVPGVLQRGRASALLDVSPLLSERRKQRADTMGSVLKSVTTGVIFTVAFFMILSEVGLNIAPLLASAGIAGVALGFGAQTLVKDFISGIFMILEDQYGVGDVVDLGEATGSVEAVGLRVTRLRSVDGAVWYVRNGEVLRVGNMSQGWARAVLDVQVAHGTDLVKVRSVLSDTAHALREDPEWHSLVLEDPEVWGVEALSMDAIVVRVVVKTAPLKQWDVARELRQRIMAAFEQHGIELPRPQRTIWMRTDGPDQDVGARPSADTELPSP